jgi:hypothetical protein
MADVSVSPVPLNRLFCTMFQAVFESGGAMALINVVDWPGPINAEATTAVLETLKHHLNQIAEESENGQIFSSGFRTKIRPGFKVQVLEAVKELRRAVPSSLWPIVVEAPHGDIKLALDNVLVGMKVLLGIIPEGQMHTVRLQQSTSLSAWTGRHRTSWFAAGASA